jgi:hypothetical protein
MPPLVLDGSAGISGVDGTASNPAIEGTDSNTGIFYPAADTVAIGTGGTERLRVDSGGNLLAGQTSIPAGWGVSPRTSIKQSSTSGLAGFVSFSSSNENAIAIGYDSTSSVGRIAVSYATTGSYTPLVFDVNGSEQMRLETSGNLRLSAGNLVIGTSGKGIDFSATPGTGTSELLSDYEEGNWTPNVGGNATYNFQVGRYTKIGRLVIVDYELGINVLGTGSTTELSGLPFALGGVVQASGVVSYFFGLAINVLAIAAYGFSGSVFRFYGRTTAGTASSGPLGIFGNGAYIQGNLIYIVA